MKRIVSWLWKPTGELPGFTEGYDERYVIALLRGLGRNLTPPWRLELFVDNHWREALESRSLEHLRLHAITEPMEGWSHMMQIFSPAHRPARGERILAVGLDTIIVGDCDWLLGWDEADLGWIRDPLSPGTISNSVMTFNSLGAELLWDRYQEAKAQNFPARYRIFDQPSEMMIQRSIYEEHPFPLLEEEPRRLLSYKKHTREGVFWPGGRVSVVYFHGSPKPHELEMGNPLLDMWDTSK